MILELLPPPIKVLYVKMKTSLSMQGFLETLREMLEELEWNKETSEIFLIFLNRYKKQDKQDLKKIEEAIEWINIQFQFFKRGNWKNNDLKVSILKMLAQKLKQIEEGRTILSSYLDAKMALLNQVAKLIATYGEFEVLKHLGKTQIISLSLSTDPLKTPVTEKKVIWPFTDEGEAIKDALKAGFIKAEILPPTEGYKKNRYFIEQGMVIIEWPDTLKMIVSLNIEDWRTTFDNSATRCLHCLLCYAGWQDWIAQDLKIPEYPSDKALNLFYNRWSMQRYMSEILTNQNQHEVRTTVMQVLDRFLIVLIHELGEGRRKKHDKERAEKYAYIQVKALLLLKSEEERKHYNYEKVIDLIIKKAQGEDLTFNLTRTNCLEACKRFTDQHGWPKKRGEDKKSREKGLTNKKNS